MADIDPGKLRDVLFIWLYTSVTILDQVANGTITPNQVQTTLENGNYIKAGDATNRQAIQEAITAIGREADSFSVARAQLKSLTALTEWTGPSPHPKTSELTSVFITPRH